MPDYQKELIDDRLNTAKERIRAAKLLLDAGNYRDSIGRSYYAMFSALRAMLALDLVDFNKQTGVIDYFRRAYILTGMMKEEYYQYIEDAFQIQYDCDYKDFFPVPKESAVEYYKKGQQFVKAIEKYLSKAVEEQREYDLSILRNMKEL
ncbi:MAG: HEPN domain-containing protein [Lachnospiraceae bacterium]|nr:HEPN domain-containing protein [Lachnospiraceae bacterium]